MLTSAQQQQNAARITAWMTALQGRLAEDAMALAQSALMSRLETPPVQEDSTTVQVFLSALASNPGNYNAAFDTVQAALNEKRIAEWDQFLATCFSSEPPANMGTRTLQRSYIGAHFRRQAVVPVADEIAQGILVSCLQDVSLHANPKLEEETGAAVDILMREAQGTSATATAEGTLPGILETLCRPEGRLTLRDRPIWGTEDDISAELADVMISSDKIGSTPRSSVYVVPPCTLGHRGQTLHQTVKTVEEQLGPGQGRLNLQPGTRTIVLAPLRVDGNHWAKARCEFNGSKLAKIEITDSLRGTEALRTRQLKVHFAGQSDVALDRHLATGKQSGNGYACWAHAVDEVRADMARELGTTAPASAASSEELYQHMVDSLATKQAQTSLLGPSVAAPTACTTVPAAPSAVLETIQVLNTLSKEVLQEVLQEVHVVALKTTEARLKEKRTDPVTLAAEVKKVTGRMTREQKLQLFIEAQKNELARLNQQKIQQDQLKLAGHGKSCSAALPQTASSRIFEKNMSRSRGRVHLPPERVQ